MTLSYANNIITRLNKLCKRISIPSYERRLYKIDEQRNETIRRYQNDLENDMTMNVDTKEIKQYIQIIIYIVIAVPLAVSANIDCNGKSFHCVNSTHFMICVDLGGGVSSTLNGFLIPCPPSTECQITNRFECEFPTSVSPVLNVDASGPRDIELIETTTNSGNGPAKLLQKTVTTNVLPLSTINTTVFSATEISQTTERHTETFPAQKQNIDDSGMISSKDDVLFFVKDFTTVSTIQDTATEKILSPPVIVIDSSKTNSGKTTDSETVFFNVDKGTNIHLNNINISNITNETVTEQVTYSIVNESSNRAEDSLMFSIFNTINNDNLNNSKKNVTEFTTTESSKTKNESLISDSGVGFLNNINNPSVQTSTLYETTEIYFGKLGQETTTEYAPVTKIYDFADVSKDLIVEITSLNHTYSSINVMNERNITNELLLSNVVMKKNKTSSIIDEQLDQVGKILPISKTYNDSTINSTHENSNILYDTTPTYLDNIENISNVNNVILEYNNNTVSDYPANPAKIVDIIANETQKNNEPNILNVKKNVKTMTDEYKMVNNSDIKISILSTDSVKKGTENFTEISPTINNNLSAENNNNTHRVYVSNETPLLLNSTNQNMSDSTGQITNKVNEITISTISDVLNNTTYLSDIPTTAASDTYFEIPVDNTSILLDAINTTDNSNWNIKLNETSVPVINNKSEATTINFNVQYKNNNETAIDMNESIIPTVVTFTSTNTYSVEQSVLGETGAMVKNMKDSKNFFETNQNISLEMNEKNITNIEYVDVVTESSINTSGPMTLDVEVTSFPNLIKQTHLQNSQGKYKNINKTSSNTNISDASPDRHLTHIERKTSFDSVDLYVSDTTTSSYKIETTLLDILDDSPFNIKANVSDKTIATGDPPINEVVTEYVKFDDKIAAKKDPKKETNITENIIFNSLMVDNNQYIPQIVTTSLDTVQSQIEQQKISAVNIQHTNFLSNVNQSDPKDKSNVNDSKVPVTTDTNSQLGNNIGDFSNINVTVIKHDATEGIIDYGLNKTFGFNNRSTEKSFTNDYNYIQPSILTDQTTKSTIKTVTRPLIQNFVKDIREFGEGSNTSSKFNITVAEKKFDALNSTSESNNRTDQTTKSTIKTVTRPLIQNFVKDIREFGQGSNTSSKFNITVAAKKFDALNSTSESNNRTDQTTKSTIKTVTRPLIQNFVKDIREFGQVSNTSSKFNITVAEKKFDALNSTSESNNQISPKNLGDLKFDSINKVPKITEQKHVVEIPNAFENLTKIELTKSVTQRNQEIVTPYNKLTNSTATSVIPTLFSSNTSSLVNVLEATFNTSFKLDGKSQNENKEKISAHTFSSNTLISTTISMFPFHITSKTFQDFVATQTVNETNEVQKKFIDKTHQINIAFNTSSSSNTTYTDRTFKSEKKLNIPVNSTSYNVPTPMPGLVAFNHIIPKLILQPNVSINKQTNSQYNYSNSSQNQGKYASFNIVKILNNEQNITHLNSTLDKEIPKINELSKHKIVDQTSPRRNSTSTLAMPDKLINNDLISLNGNNTQQSQEHVRLGTRQNVTYSSILPNKSKDPTENTNKLLDFRCHFRKRGRYSDKQDCSKYYICIGRLQPIYGKCPVNSVFSEITKQCTKNMKHCNKDKEFKCISGGRFSDISIENTYYICVTNGNGFVRFKFQCQNGYYLDQNSVKCIQEENLEYYNQSSMSIENSKSEKSLFDYPNTDIADRDNVDDSNYATTFKCKAEGVFGDINDCRKYYICKKNKKLEFRRRKKTCDSDEVFHKDKKKCVDGDSYECSV